MKTGGPSWGRLAKRTRRGFRGYPLGTLAFYGPSNEYASKVAVGIILRRDSDPADMKRWYARDCDLRHDPAIAEEIWEYLRSHAALTVVMPRGIIGCPHEEGIEYPAGGPCPLCPFWEGRDRWKEV